MKPNKYHTKYRDLLAQFPAPGGGGAHRSLFTAGCLGCRAGLTSEQVCEDLREKIPEGTRIVSDKEIAEGVQAGFAEVQGGSEAPVRPPPLVSPDQFAKMVTMGRGATAAAISAKSPWPVDGQPWEVTCRFLNALYGKEELLFIGDDKVPGVLGDSICSSDEWKSRLMSVRDVPWPKIIMNPLTGEPAPKRGGEGMTLRGDACVSSYRLVLLEMDSVPIEDQLAFWAVASLPIVALIHSGGKSLHGWVRVSCADAREWEVEIKNRLFPQVFEPLGFDGACKNAARLSRLPGHWRKDKEARQELLWLAPGGKAVSL